MWSRSITGLLYIDISRLGDYQTGETMKPSLVITATVMLLYGLHNLLGLLGLNAGPKGVPVGDGYVCVYGDRVDFVRMVVLGVAIFVAISLSVAARLSAYRATGLRLALAGIVMAVEAAWALILLLTSDSCSLVSMTETTLARLLQVAIAGFVAYAALTAVKRAAD